ncbi:VOC family protein [Segatella buccae]|uniref:VOC family protein n=1 Tax=Segatella buccae TaxID=28126 RepID=UPI002FDB4EAF
MDHFVLTTRSLADCLHFYTDVFGMRHEERGVHHALYSGTQKINVHTVKDEFRPAAQYLEYGSQDFCLVTDDDLHTVKEELRRVR